MYLCVMWEMRETEYDTIIDTHFVETMDEAKQFQVENTKGNIYVEIV